jgi:hypothetical protein
MRLPGTGFRYGPPPGASDTLTAAWAVFALKSARQARLVEASAVFADAREWFVQATDPSGFRTGFRSAAEGGAPPPEASEIYTHPDTPTAAALAARLLMGDDRKDPLIAGGAQRLMKSLPSWDEKSGSIDWTYWYFGTQAAFLVGGDCWKAWAPAMRETLLKNVRKDGCARGSIDPAGVPGKARGRAYTTAMGALILEIVARTERAPSTPAPTVDTRSLPPAPAPEGTPQARAEIRVPECRQTVPVHRLRERDLFFQIACMRNGAFADSRGTVELDAMQETLYKEAKSLPVSQIPGASDLAVLLIADRDTPWKYVRHFLRLCAAPPVCAYRVWFAVETPEADEKNRVLRADIPFFDGRDSRNASTPYSKIEFSIVRLDAVEGGAGVRVQLNGSDLGSGPAGLQELLTALKSAHGKKGTDSFRIAAGDDVRFAWAVRALDVGVEAQMQRIEFAE